MTPEEVQRRGKSTPPIPTAIVAKALERVRRSGVLTLLADWRTADREPGLLGGRPALLSDEAVLTGLLLMADEKQSLHLTLLADLFQMRLKRKARALLGIPDKSRTHWTNTHERKRWYANTARAYHRIIELVDPFPQERRSAKYYSEIEKILANHDSERAIAYRERLTTFTNAFIAMTFWEQPDDLLEASDQLDISFDQTYLQAPTKKRYWHQHLDSHLAKEKRTPEGHRPQGPVDAFVGHHTVDGERKDYQPGEQGKDTGYQVQKNTINKWGWTANLAVRVDSESPKRRRTPGIIVAASLSVPATEVSEEAVDLMRFSNNLGLRPGLSDADKQYWANARPERLHDPAIALGWTPSTDYRVDRLKPSGEEHGAKFLEGNVYCPSTPPALLNATEKYFDGDIDKETFRARKTELTFFKLHVKERKPNGKTMMRCPALGPSPTVTCPLRELAKNAANKARPEVDEADLHPADVLDEICKKHSVAFDLEEGKRNRQGFDYGTEEWENFHKHARNSIESINAQIKRGGEHDLESSSRRRVRGMAAAQVMMTMVITAFNLDKIAAFIGDRLHEDATGGPKPKAPRARDSKWWNQYTDTYPPGVIPPPDAKRRRGRVRTDDGTGGPSPST
jgi:hypothetical protein